MLRKVAANGAASKNAEHSDPTAHDGAVSDWLDREKQYEREREWRNEPPEDVVRLQELHRAVASLERQGERGSRLARAVRELETALRETCDEVEREPRALASALARIELATLLLGEVRESYATVVAYAFDDVRSTRLVVVRAVYSVAMQWKPDDEPANRAECASEAEWLAERLEVEDVGKLASLLFAAAAARLGDTVSGGFYRKTLALMEAAGVEGADWRKNVVARTNHLKTEVSKWTRDHRLPAIAARGA